MKARQNLRVSLSVYYEGIKGGQTNCIFLSGSGFSGKGGVVMKHTDEEDLLLGRRFEKFGNKLIDNAVINAIQRRRRHSQRQAFISDVFDEEPPSRRYWLEPGDCADIFTPFGIDVVIRNYRLNQALRRMTEDEQAIILLHYGHRFTDEDISKMFARWNHVTVPRRTMTDWRHASWKKFLKMMGGKRR